MMLLVIAIAAAAAATLASPAAACQSDLDCQLNGVCTAGACVCDSAWSGPNCGSLLVQPGELAYAPALSTSWGGGPPVYDAARQKWVLFVTEIANHCGLSEWQHQSTVVAALSDTPFGPYSRDALVIPPQAHNPYYVQDPVTKTHLIFHIGGGDNPPTPSHPFKNCTNGTTPSGPVADPPTPVYSQQPYVHYSDSLQGPFQRLNITLPAGAAPLAWGSDNPAPYIFPNGTVLMLTRRYQDPHKYKPHDTIWLVRAPSFRGPYEFVFDRPVFEHENFDEEDPCLWRDARGHFHALFHFTHGHAWSADGLDWHWGGGVSAWTSSLRLANGTVVKLADAERPRIFVNSSSGQPELLFIASGGQRQPTSIGQNAKGFTVVQRIGRA